MEKVFGATQRYDQLTYYTGTQRAMLIYGFGLEGDNGYDWRHTFDHHPTADELKEVITQHIDAQTDGKILSGFVWNGQRVWLSAENQRNFSEAQRAAMITKGESLPVTFKIGEDEHKAPVYHEFTTVEELTDFYLQAFAYINQTLNEGWREKDAAAEWVDSLEL